MAWSSLDLLTGLAEHLADGAGVDWRPPPAAYTAPYSGPVAVYETLPAAPVRAVALSVYLGPLSQSGLSDVLAGVQLLYRGPDPATVHTDADRAFDLLDGAKNLVLGQPGREIHAALIERQASAPLDLDGSGHRLRSDSYYIHASRRTAWRPD